MLIAKIIILAGFIGFGVFVIAGCLRVCCSLATMGILLEESLGITISN